jgi:hypothetical protein
MEAKTCLVIKAQNKEIKIDLTLCAAVIKHSIFWNITQYSQLTCNIDRRN